MKIKTKLSPCGKVQIKRKGDVKHHENLHRTIAEWLGYSDFEELMNRETKDKVDVAKKGYLGISGLNVTTDVSTMYGMPEGVYVAQVYHGGAYEAGIMKGDIITAFDGSSVRTMEDLQGYLEYYEIGETVSVTIQRPNAGGYVEQQLMVTLGAAQEQIP